MQYGLILSVVVLAAEAPATDREVETPIKLGVDATPAAIIEFLRPRNLERVAKLIEQLAANDFKSREEASRQLSGMRVFPRAALERAAKDADPERRYRAMVLLKNTSRPEIDADLLAVLKMVRGEAYVAVTPVLLELIEHSGQPQLVAATGAALRDVARPKHTELLRRSIRSANANVRATAATALAAVLKKRAHDELRPLLSDEDDRVRLAVALTLLNSSTDLKALSTLGTLLAADDMGVRAGAVRALRTLSGKQFGYLACDESSSRAKSARAWQAWIAALEPQGKLHPPVDLDGWVSGALRVQGKLRATLEGHRNEVPVIIFSPDGKNLATASWDNNVMIWETATGNRRHTLSGHTGCVRSLAFSPDGTTLFSGSADKTIRVWDPAVGGQSHVLTTGGDFVLALACSPDGKSFVSGGADGNIKLWNTAELQNRRLPKQHAGCIRCTAFSHDGKTFASASGDGTVKLWDAATGRVRATLKGHTNKVWFARRSQRSVVGRESPRRPRRSPASLEQPRPHHQALGCSDGRSASNPDWPPPQGQLRRLLT